MNDVGGAALQFCVCSGHLRDCRGPDRGLDRPTGIDSQRRAGDVRGFRPGFRRHAGAAFRLADPRLPPPVRRQRVQPFHAHLLPHCLPVGRARRLHAVVAVGSDPVQRHRGGAEPAPQPGTDALRGSHPSWPRRSCFWPFSFSPRIPSHELPQAPLDGQGLNPLLQNPLMVIHPPNLYLGFVGFAVPFSFGIGALASGRLDSQWVRSIRALDPHPLAVPDRRHLAGRAVGLRGIGGGAAIGRGTRWKTPPCCRG